MLVVVVWLMVMVVPPSPPTTSDHRVELLCQGIDDAGAQPGLRHSSAFTPNARPVICYRKRPIGASDLVGNDNPAIFLVFGERVLERVEHSFNRNIRGA